MSVATASKEGRDSVPDGEVPNSSGMISYRDAMPYRKFVLAQNPVGETTGSFAAHKTRNSSHTENVDTDSEGAHRGRIFRTGRSLVETAGGVTDNGASKCPAPRSTQRLALAYRSRSRSNNFTVDLDHHSKIFHQANIWYSDIDYNFVISRISGVPPERCDWPPSK